MTRRKTDSIENWPWGLIKEEIRRRGGPVRFLEDHPESPKRPTLYQIFNGKKRPDSKAVLLLEKELGWPKGTVMLLVRKDFDALVEIGVDEEFVRYARRVS